MVTAEVVCNGQIRLYLKDFKDIEFLRFAMDRLYKACVKERVAKSRVSFPFPHPTPFIFF